MFDGDPIKTAKWYKLHSHVLFGDRPSLWLDANYGASSKNNPAELLPDFEHIMLQPHQLGNPYLEAKSCQDMGKVADVVKFEQQIAFYRRDGLPDTAPSYRGGILFRKPTEETIRFNLLWWNEILKWQMRDQLSLAYVIWKYNISVVPFVRKGFIGRRGNHERKD
jgi:hypothetical protein